VTPNTHSPKGETQAPSGPLPHLETFVEAAERGSFTAAARELGLTQAAVSQRIHQLETDLNTRLFCRESTGATLTDAGRRLYEFARRILDLTDEARAAVTGARREARGELLLAASSVPGQHLLPTILAEFRLRHPHVEVRVAVSDTDDVLRQVESGRAQLGLVGGQGGGSQLDFRRLAWDELVLVVPTGHAWWAKERVAVNDLLAQPLILREPGSGSRHCLERALERLGLVTSALNVTLELGSNEAIKEAVLARVGGAFLSRRTVERELRAGQLRAIEVASLTLDRSIYIVHNRRRVLPRPAQLFLAALRPEDDQNRLTP
jgi:DNA-binding transcriptional LysR family regulator